MSRLISKLNYDHISPPRLSPQWEKLNKTYKNLIIPAYGEKNLKQIVFDIAILQKTRNLVCKILD